jgi:hypothetical protein
MSPVVSSTRRTFLRGLANLPLIGGSVAILGQPTAAAVPVTDALCDRYIDWLSVELGEALMEREGRRAPPGHADFAIDFRREWCRQNRTLNSDPASDRFQLLPMVAPSTRAAVILSAAGVPLGGVR